MLVLACWRGADGGACESRAEAVAPGMSLSRALALLGDEYEVIERSERYIILHCKAVGSGICACTPNVVVAVRMNVDEAGQVRSLRVSDR